MSMFYEFLIVVEIWLFYIVYWMIKLKFNKLKLI